MEKKYSILAKQTEQFKKYFRTINPDKLKAQSEYKAVMAFRAAVKNSPAYADFIKKSTGIDPRRVNKIQHFKEFVPILDKDKVFGAYSGKIESWCKGTNLDNVGEIVSSSGHSGKFSFGINSRSSQKYSRQLTDIMLDYTFGISRKKTLLINTLAMGIRISSDYVTVADTGPRTDTVIALLKEFAPKFEQVIVAADNNFIKNTLEEARESHVDTKDVKIHLILGEEILAENLRSYLASLLYEDLDNPDGAFIGSSFGIAELGLNLLFETRQSIRLRRVTQKDNQFSAPPAIFQYLPTRAYLEEYESKESGTELLMTNLDDSALLPLVRYNTKENAKLIASPKGELPLNLPFITVYGRDKLIAKDGLVIRPELIKEALFLNCDVASSVTGYFRISQTDGVLNIDVQLKKGKDNLSQIRDNIQSSFSYFLKFPHIVNVHPYYSFPFGLELDYERKFRYI
ncbi:MAG: hypothetical protein Q8L26_06115 [Candidatus Omnitrophota bacterium]|nr:hypothetical protein [Candidatus Omnitrophota bacterium]